MKRAAYGIDLGTTNRCIARFTGAGALEVIPIDGGPTVPSVVAFDGHEWLCAGGARQPRHAGTPQRGALHQTPHGRGALPRASLREELSPVQVSAKILAWGMRTSAVTRRCSRGATGSAEP